MPREPAKTFADLLVWQRPHQFVLGVYRFSELFLRNALFGLTSQLRRAAVSIPANIAEGFKRRGKLAKGRFLNISQASIEECRYYLILARDLNYGNEPSLMKLLEEVSKLLDSYTQSVYRSVLR